MERQMSKPKRHYTEEFKQQSLKLLETTGKTATEVERELGITQGLLSRWKRKQEKRGEYATNATRPDDLIDAEITQLRRENAILRQEREILKKVVAIFSSPSG
jgi:transposase